ncbi:cell division protein FtsA [Candidatus Microgenomates bacterium]|nr:cell division protein FtsA [Candidatus Microgenomates bacterium]
MNKTKIIAAIELGSSKTATIIGQVQTDENSFEKSISVIGVSAVESAGIKKGQIVNIEESVEAAISSIEAAERMAGHNLSSAFVSVGGAHIHSQNSRGVVAVSGVGGEIGVSDVDRVIDAASAISLPASREVIHVLPREYIVDGETGVKDPIGMSGVRLEVDTHVVTASTAAVKNLTKSLGEAGVNIDDLVFTGLASSESVLSDTEKELGCVLIDIGAGTTSVAVFIEGSLAYSGVIPVGARNVTNDIAIGLRVSLEAAEKIKIFLSSERKRSPQENSKNLNQDDLDVNALGITELKKVSKKTLTEGIIRPRLNEIFTMVRLELEKEQLLNRIPSGAVVTGGGAKTVGVVDSAKRMMSLPVRIGVPGGVVGLIDDVIDPMFSTALGLLIFGSKQDGEGAGGFKFPGKLSFKKPNLGLFGKMVESIKDLLP